jgi:hypothetical protein
MAVPPRRNKAEPSDRRNSARAPLPAATRAPASTAAPEATRTGAPPRATETSPAASSTRACKGSLRAGAIFRPLTRITATTTTTSSPATIATLRFQLRGFALALPTMVLLLVRRRLSPRNGGE